MTSSAQIAEARILTHSESQIYQVANQPTPLGESTSRPYQRIRSNTASTIMIDHSPRNGKELKKVNKNRVPAPTDPRQVTTSIDNSITDPSTTKVSNIKSSAITKPVRFTNKTVKNNTFFILSSARPLTLEIRAVSRPQRRSILSISRRRSPSLTSSNGQNHDDHQANDQHNEPPPDCQPPGAQHQKIAKPK